MTGSAPTGSTARSSAELGGLRVEGDPAFFLTAHRWTTD
jgi:hypothetical protein